ncbi:beta-N-acetylhexosaminidase [Patiriisocius hiemis]|uniref:beta-N-acetylhexosaminidase n=1 Tax=Patiriisocius hiemis TaxID=3075604 RepID=A0ABU2YD38_9FLAO|nr:family 20 glycosylhydrolase [Constantimarinum sp. W242]MDT0555677.1 family 20 glycosylhydrolase [Constantimarinum sp. W242]
MKTHYIIFSIFISVLLSCTSEKEIQVSKISIIPKPQQLEIGNDVFELTSKTTFSAPKEFEVATNFLNTFLSNGAGIELEATSENSTIVFKKDSLIVSEGYSLSVSKEGIEINSSDASGAFYAVQSLRQLLPPDLEQINLLPKKSIKIPVVKITDAPKFKYRGMHLDVSRHFFPKEFIKQYISHLSMLKMNTFHWHLTDDQGWRIEIKKHPRLTQHAAYRDSTLIGHYNDIPQHYKKERYGGFYTQEDIKEIVTYAAQLNITIIPEIEMPGHAQAAVSAYPELGCTGNQVPVASKWGVFENIYCPNQKTMTFLKDVLTETMELFPSEYIHIGGDEAPKKQWKNCAHCQQLIKKHNLKDEAGLQSWFIKEIETFVNSKGKKIIGWDEILEGGLAPNATVMSWRGTEGAVTAAKQGNDVILTPTSHAYFDYYQDDSYEEPLAIGGFLPLKKVYSFNPIPHELSKEEATHVLGAQGNIWTEYMPTTDQVEYMLFPRVLAMSEVVWSGPTKNVEKDYPNFLARVESFIQRLDVLHVNYANHLYDLESAIVKKNDSLLYKLKTHTEGKEIRYTLNKQEEKVYDTPILIIEDATIKAQVYKDNKPVGRVLNDTITYHKGLKANIQLNVEPHPAYSAGGKDALINGISGSNTRYGDKEWLGFWGDDLEIVITFPEPTKVSGISTRFYNANGQWIYSPYKGQIKLVSKGNNEFKADIEYEINPDSDKVSFEFDVSEENLTEAYKIILTIPNYGIIPEGLQGSGNPAWTFIDEIVIR